MCFTIDPLEFIVDAYTVHGLDYTLYTTSILLCVMLYVMYQFFLFALQADMYKKDFERERNDRTRLAGQIEKANLTRTVKQEQHHFGDEEHLKKVQLVFLQEAYAKAVKKVSDYDKDVSDLRQTLQTKEETWKRSLEEARASSSKLDEEVMLLTQQVKQYKKQADNLRSQLENYVQMNKSQVQQVLQRLYMYVRVIML